ncbi:Hypothetical predicted protein [Marmota monax]|uniref:Ig-like domain-containing protein n=1 Tax=Marmota monax TaxID=9995 RepID=A0A5E4CTH7_MARMO|nr:Hypothetical predicted protein [Marmota monax]
MLHSPVSAHPHTRATRPRPPPHLLCVLPWSWGVVKRTVRFNVFCECQARMPRSLWAGLTGSAHGLLTPLTRVFSLLAPSVLAQRGCLPFLPPGEPRDSALPFLSLSPSPRGPGQCHHTESQEGQSLHLVCDADSDPPATLSWTHGGLTLSPSQPLDPQVLNCPRWS